MKSKLNAINHASMTISEALILSFFNRMSGRMIFISFPIIIPFLAVPGGFRLRISKYWHPRRPIFYTLFNFNLRAVSKWKNFSK
jgi:hypothetical protein